MDAPDPEQTLEELLNASTAMRVEEVLDDAGIRLVRSGLDPRQIREFWNRLRDNLDPAAHKEQSILGRSRLLHYARVSLLARANR